MSGSCADFSKSWSAAGSRARFASPCNPRSAAALPLGSSGSLSSFLPQAKAPVAQLSKNVIENRHSARIMVKEERVKCFIMCRIAGRHVASSAHPNCASMAPKRLCLALLLACTAAAEAAAPAATSSSAAVKTKSSRKRGLESSEESEDVAEQRGPAYDAATVDWLIQQTGMYQTRTALLSTELSKHYGVRPIIPQPPGLLCAKSTKEHPLRCRVYMEPEEGSKVVAPCRCKGSQRW
jgi:hypothetical protein